MKTNKRYIASSLVWQMVVLPILLSLGLFAVSSLYKLLLPPDLGKHTLNFIHLLVAFIGPLLVGGFIGYAYSAIYKRRPDSAKTRYLTVLFPVVYALVFALLATVMSEGNYNSEWWGIYVFKTPTFLLLAFGLFFTGLQFIIPVVELAGYIGFILGIYLWDHLRSSGDTYEELSSNLKTIIASLVVIVIAFVGMINKDKIDSGVIEIRYGKSTIGSELNEFNLIKIAPFKESNGLVKLGKPASLLFQDLEDMPHLDGATALYPVYAAFVESVYKGLGEYYQANKENNQKDIYTAFVSSKEYPWNIIRCSKTGTAYERLINGQTDIIFVLEPSKAHLEAIKAKGDEFVLTPIGSEAFVFFTNARNPVEALTVKQIQDIYTGKIINWREVGGSEAKIMAFQRPENSGSQTIMQNLVMKNIKMSEPTKETFAGGMGGMISQVASYQNAKNAIGYSFLYYSSEMMKNNQIKYLSIDGVKPTPEAIRSKAYPFTVPLYAVTLKSNKKDNVLKFINWATSEEGQELVRKTGYIPMK